MDGRLGEGLSMVSTICQFVENPLARLVTLAAVVHKDP